MRFFSTDPVGRSWESPRGTRVVSHIGPVGGKPHAFIKTGDRSGFDILAVDEVEDEIRMDTSRVKSRARAAEAQGAEAADREERSAWNGFTATLSPRMRGKAVKTLEVQVRRSGIFYARGDLIRMLVGEGWVLGHNRTFGDVLESPEGGFLDKKALTKTGLDYARFLLR